MWRYERSLGKRKRLDGYWMFEQENKEKLTFDEEAQYAIGRY
jgi:hypothetical protein